MSTAHSHKILGGRSFSHDTTATLALNVASQIVRLVSGGQSCRVIGRIGPHVAHDIQLDRHTGDRTIIRLSGDGGTNLDVDILDRKGCVCAKGHLPIDEELIVFYAPRDGRYTMRIVNLGNRINAYDCEII